MKRNDDINEGAETPRPTPYENQRVMAEIEYHRALERAERAFADRLAVLVERDVVDAPPLLKGQIQRRLVRIAGLATQRGMTAPEVAREADYDEANTYTVLGSLEKQGLLEQVEGSPRRWRLALKHRRNRILRLSRLIPDGRWTTYGDFSIAIYDNWRMAVTIGQQAAHNPAFANPHRVLKAGGLIPPDWEDGGKNGPEECERRLAKDGIDVVDGRADPAKFIGWEELKRLLAAQEEALEADEAA